MDEDPGKAIILVGLVMLGCVAIKGCTSRLDAQTLYPDLKPPAAPKSDTVKADTIPWHWDILGRRVTHG